MMFSHHFVRYFRFVTVLFSVAHLIFDLDDEVIIHCLTIFRSESMILLSVVCHSMPIEADIYISRFIHIGITSEHYDTQCG